MGIFKAYDIRGVVPEELDVDTAHAIGRAIAHHLGASPLAVGRDARVHSPDLLGALVRGICDEGVDVLDLGLVSTPILYHAVGRHRAGGGVMVTASHNPGRYNGFKICRAQAVPVGEASGLREIEALVESRRSAPPVEPRGTQRDVDALEGYLDHVLSVGGSTPSLTVAIDCGNGMAGVGLEPLLDRLPLRTERLYFEPDGSFPNHEANPLKRENLEDLCAAVKRSGADFGVAFDGDADRAVFVDEHADPVSSDLVTALLARHQLRRHPGALILYDLRSSWVVPEEIERAGGVAQMSRVGHSFVKAQMRSSGAIFAGELSGHFYFRFPSDLIADDGVAAFVALLDVLGREGRSLSELVAPLRRYAASGEINSRVEDVQQVLEQIESEHRDAPEVSKLDGLLVRYDDWWFNLRPSNTEPVLRLNLEARDVAQMERERERLLARIRSSG